MNDQAERLRDAIQSRNERAAANLSLSSRVITITSGKGGVGKTNFAVNLGLELRRLGKRVLILDADFGLANIELILGVTPRYSLADMLFGGKSIEEVVQLGPQGVQFISGGSGLKELANISDRQMNYLLHNFTYLDKISDIIIIDTGAGISKSVVNFVKASGEAIVVTTPEPTSVTDAYALIKTVADGTDAPDFKLVINRVESSLEGEEVFQKLQKVSERFLNVKLKYLGSIPYDHNLVRAVKKQQPVSIANANAPFSKSVAGIAELLLEIDRGKEEKKGILSFMKRLVGFTGK